MSPLVCRTCLREAPLVSLFTQHSQISIQLWEMLDYCASIQVQTNDGLPSEICQNCANLLATFYNFKKSAIENDQKLRRAVPTAFTEINIKEEPLDEEEQLQTSITSQIVIKSESDLNPPLEEPRQPPKRPKKLHQCHICGRIFRDHSGLVRHTRVHTGDKPYECDVCNRRFTQSDHLKSHKLTHTGERPYRCSLCPKSFAQHSTLGVHLRTHGVRSPHVCKVCGKTFTHAKTLNCHVRLHGGDVKFECVECDKRFVYARNYNVHMRNHNMATFVAQEGDACHKWKSFNKILGN